MIAQRRERLIAIILLVLGISAAIALALYALKQNINLYLTPVQLAQKKMVNNEMFRLGGMVVKGSVYHQPNSLYVRFALTDYHTTVNVVYNGILPALFREGQGIVAQGKLNANGIFVADEVLAKHDANYKPPSIGPQPTSTPKFTLQSES